MREPVPSRSERVYALLLRVFPADFRDAYGADLQDTFRDRLGEVGRGETTLARLWVRTAWDLFTQGVAERVARASGREEARRALRRIARRPGLPAMVVGTLAVGIGATVALFTVVHAVVLSPLPFPEADQLVRLWETPPAVDGEPRGPSPLNVVDWQRESAVFEGIAAWYLTSGTYRTDRWVEEIRSAQVSPEFFEVLGVGPALGPGFDGVDGTHGPVMLSHDLWVRRFGADPEVVGRSVIVSGNSYRIAGVMPQGFDFPDPAVEAWSAWNLPAVYGPNPDARSWRFLEVVARLSDGVTQEAALADLSRVAAGLSERYPAINRGWGATLKTMHEHEVGPVRGTLWTAFGAVGLILLIACTNVANVLLAHVPERVADLRLRVALGADRASLTRELATEYLTLAALAGILGTLLAAGLVRLLGAFGTGAIPRLDEVGLDPALLAFAVLVTGATTLLFGLAPAAQLLRESDSRAGSAGRVTDDRSRRVVAEGLIVGQVALAMVLLSGALLFGRSLGKILAVEIGFTEWSLATFRVSLDPVEESEQEIVDYYDGLMAELTAVPGIDAVGLAQTLPLNPVGNDFRRPFRPAGYATESFAAPTVQMRIVSPNYAQAIGLPLLAGQPLPDDAVAGEPLVALVNETMARQLVSGGDAVGRVVGSVVELEFRDGWQRYEILGVVGDVHHYGPRADPEPEVYLSHRQVPYLAMSVVARTAGPADRFTEPLKGAVLSWNPGQPAHNFVSMERLIDDVTAGERFLSVLLTVFAMIAVVLVASGLYGVIGYSVNRRRREIGLRMALGAERHRVAMGVLGRAGVMTAAGIAAGIALVALLSPWVASLLFGVGAADPVSHLASALGVAAVAAVAAARPALSAARVAPATTLRAE